MYVKTFLPLAAFATVVAAQAGGPVCCVKGRDQLISKLNPAVFDPLNSHGSAISWATKDNFVQVFYDTVKQVAVTTLTYSDSNPLELNFVIACKDAAGEELRSQPYHCHVPVHVTGKDVGYWTTNLAMQTQYVAGPKKGQAGVCANSPASPVTFNEATFALASQNKC